MEIRSNCLLWLSKLEMMCDGYIDENNNLFLVYYPDDEVKLMPIDEYDEAYENDITIYPG